MKPRPYQITAVENALKAIFAEVPLNPVIAAPPGTGKSSMIAWTTRAIIQRVPHARIMICVHVKELVDQDSSELKRIWPDAPLGIYSAGMNSKQYTAQITVGSIQSIHKNPHIFGKINVLIIDEAHLLSPDAETRYQKLIEELRKKNPYLVVIGYSATPWRMKHGLLTEGNIFNHLAFDNTQRDEFVNLIDEGYLVPLIPKQTSFEYDVSKVRKTGGDFNRSALEKAVNVDELTEQALQECLQVAETRKHWMIFCSGIDHVDSVTERLLELGEKAVKVHSRIKETERDAAIDDFKSGRARIIVSEGVLTTGFNSPWVDCIVLLRPTSSPGLHVQILGRGIRPYYASGFDLDKVEGRLAAIEASEKQNCLVLDFAGNSARLGPINDPVLPKKKGQGTGEIPIKICPACGTYNHAAARECIGIHWDNTKCDHVFEFKTKLEQTAATVELIARDGPIMVWFKVDRVEYEYIEEREHRGKPAAMRVHYYCGMRRFSDWVSIEHERNYPARKWWREHLPNYPPPPTSLEGYEYAPKLPKPTDIYVWVNKKYPQILKRSFDGTRPEYKS